MNKICDAGRLSFNVMSEFYEKLVTPTVTCGAEACDKKEDRHYSMLGERSVHEVWLE